METSRCRSSRLRSIIAIIDTPPMRAGHPPADRLDRRLHAVSAGRGDADGVARIAPRNRAGAGLAAPSDAGACPPFTDARRPRARPPRPAAETAHHRGTGAGGRGQRRRDPRHGRCRVADRRAAPLAQPFRPPTPPILGRPCRPTRKRRRRRCATRWPARILGHAAGWRHRLGQDRGLPGGDRPGAAGRPPGAGAAAGDRAVLAMAVAVRAAVRRGPGGLALRPDLARAAHHVAGGGRGQGPGGGRRPVGAVPAVSGSGLRRRRRGARDRVQAGGGHRLPRPRHGGGAGAAVRGAGDPGLGDAQSGDGGECGGGPVWAAAFADPAWRRGDAADRGDRPAGGRAGAGPFPGAETDRGDPRHDRAGRAGDAVPQPPRLRAADAVPALRAPHAVPQLHRLAGGAPRPPRTALPPLRPRRADPGEMPGVRGRTLADRGRARRRADHRGSRGAVSRTRGAW